MTFVYEPHVEAGFFKFSTSPRSNIIKIHQGALELLWAASFAFPVLFEICPDSNTKGRDRVSAAEFPDLQKAFRLYGWALNKCSREASEPWPEDFPSPGDGDFQAKVATELFLVAVGWILLHESAHILLDHKIDGPKELRKREEREADRFATEWLLQEVTDRKILQKRSLGIAIANLTLMALDLRGRRLDLPQHPRSVERLNTNLRNFLSEGDGELVYALAIAVLQAHFSIFGVTHTIDNEASVGILLDGLCVDLTRHEF